MLNLRETSSLVLMRLQFSLPSTNGQLLDKGYKWLTMCSRQCAANQYSIQHITCLSMKFYLHHNIHLYNTPCVCIAKNIQSVHIRLHRWPSHIRSLWCYESVMPLINSTLHHHNSTYTAMHILSCTVPAAHPHAYCRWRDYTAPHCYLPSTLMLSVVLSFGLHCWQWAWSDHWELPRQRKCPLWETLWIHWPQDPTLSSPLASSGIGQNVSYFIVLHCILITVRPEIYASLHSTQGSI